MYAPSSIQWYLCRAALYVQSVTERGGTEQFPQNVKLSFPSHDSQKNQMEGARCCS